MSSTMASRHDDAELSPISPGEDSDVPVVVQEPEPAPGLDGIPVRCELQNSSRQRSFKLTLV